MSDDRTKSAIDAIYELLKTINNLEIKIDNIDANVKLLNNKVNKLSIATPAPPSAKKAPPRAAPGPSSSSSPLKNVVIDQAPGTSSGALVIGKIRTFGYILNKQKMPLDNVSVNIYNQDNELVRNIKTNKDGFWEARLPSGRYGLEYIHSNFKPINLVVNLDDSMKEYEVKR